MILFYFMLVQSVVNLNFFIIEGFQEKFFEVENKLLKLQENVRESANGEVEKLKKDLLQNELMEKDEKIKMLEGKLLIWEESTKLPEVNGSHPSESSSPLCKLSSTHKISFSATDLITTERGETDNCVQEPQVIIHNI